MKRDPVGLTDFKIPLNKLAPLQSFRNREGLELSYRFYSTWSDRLLIFYHGIGGDSRYICALADFLSQNNFANVLTPDFRGHGKSRAEVAHVTDPESLLNDLQDLLTLVENQYPGKELFIGGHSLGGGFALKALAHPTLQKYFKGGVVVSPYLHILFQDQGSLRFNSWIHFDQKTKRLELQMPPGYRSGSETAVYDLAFFEAASLNNKTEFAALKGAPKIVTIASTGDQLSPASRYQQLLPVEEFHLHVLQDYSHMGVVMAPAALKSISEIIQKEFLWA